MWDPNLFTVCFICSCFMFSHYLELREPYKSVHHLLEYYSFFFESASALVRNECPCLLFLLGYATKYLKPSV